MFHKYHLPSYWLPMELGITRQEALVFARENKHRARRLQKFSLREKNKMITFKQALCIIWRVKDAESQES